jgi:hypothetical protein
MINYLFMGKVQCELQLSIQETKTKEKQYYTFAHLVYELTRGAFGSIAECAVMISQLDPMISASKGKSYREKEDEININLLKNHSLRSRVMERKFQSRKKLKHVDTKSGDLEEEMSQV